MGDCEVQVQTQSYYGKSKAEAEKNRRLNVQTNKINGLNTISLINLQHPTLPLVGLNSGGTVNQKAEAAAAKLGYYGLISPDPHLFSLALDRCISQLQDELTRGHMLQELLSDSHEPIHLRARTSLKLYILRLRRNGLYVGSREELDKLESLLDGWFESHLALLSLGLIPSGPLQGCILLPCSRKRGATRNDPPRDPNSPMLYSVGWQQGRDPWPGDPVREGVLALIAGSSSLPHRQPSVRPKSTHLGKGAQLLSTSSPDTAAIPITQMILDKGGFGPNVLRGSLPKFMAPNFKVTYYTDDNGHPSGHWARFGDSQEARERAGATLLDSVTSLRVEYESGRFSFLEPSVTPHPFSGSQVIGEVSWDENGDPQTLG